MTNLCASLVDEHRVIEKVLNAIESEADRIDNGAAPNADFIERAIRFIREFADGVHHHKEERVLFPALQAAGIPKEGGPVGVMLAEHDIGRKLVASVESALRAVDPEQPDTHAAVVRPMRDYVALLREHIIKEDSVLFPMADQVCSDTQKREIARDFREAEESERAVADPHRQWTHSL